MYIFSYISQMKLLCMYYFCFCHVKYLKKNAKFCKVLYKGSDSDGDWTCFSALLGWVCLINLGKDGENLMIPH